jgi:hypothetical protein
MMNRYRPILGAMAMLVTAVGSADDTAPPGQTIAYAVTNLSWALQSTPEMGECPNGLN